MKVGDLVRVRHNVIDHNESIDYLRNSCNNKSFYYEMGIILKLFHATWYTEAFVYCPITKSKLWHDTRELVNVE